MAGRAVDRARAARPATGLRRVAHPAIGRPLLAAARSVTVAVTVRRAATAAQKAPETAATVPTATAETVTRDRGPTETTLVVRGTDVPRANGSLARQATTVDPSAPAGTPGRAAASVAPASADAMTPGAESAETATGAATASVGTATEDATSSARAVVRPAQVATDVATPRDERTDPPGTARVVASGTAHPAVSRVADPHARVVLVDRPGATAATVRGAPDATSSCGPATDARPAEIEMPASRAGSTT